MTFIQPALSALFRRNPLIFRVHPAHSAAYCSQWRSLSVAVWNSLPADVRLCQSVTHTHTHTHI